MLICQLSSPCSVIETFIYLSFGVFVLALLHGLFSGTDSSAAWAFWMYVGTGLSVLALMIYRIVVARRKSAPARPMVSSAI